MHEEDEDSVYKQLRREKKREEALRTRGTGWGHDSGPKEEMWDLESSGRLVEHKEPDSDRDGSSDE
jgi:hypothetical protein